MSDPRPIAIYNTQEKKLAFVCRSIAIAAKVVYGSDVCKTSELEHRIIHYLKKGTLIKNSVFPYPLKIKDATISQTTLLGTNKFIEVKS